MQDFETVDCPYCGEPTLLAIDVSAGAQRYVEDCQVCCRPMTVTVSPSPSPQGSPQVSVRAQDDA